MGAAAREGGSREVTANRMTICPEFRSRRLGLSARTQIVLALRISIGNGHGCLGALKGRNYTPCFYLVLTAQTGIAQLKLHLEVK
jgi:hypothetical protein